MLLYALTQVRTSIVAGVGLSLAMFLLWDAAILGTPPPACLDAPMSALKVCMAGAASLSGTSGAVAAVAVDPLQALQAAGGAVGPVVGAFSFLAVATSYIGFVLGLTDFMVSWRYGGTCAVMG